MPYQDGKYVAPTWSNNAPPPINASELQAIADKCEDTWDKDETISAETAAIYGLGEGYTPDQAFRAISTNFNRTINVTVTLDGAPVEGVTVTGITTEDGEPCVTNSEGKTSGVTGVDTVTIATSTGCVDVNEASQIVETGGALSTDATMNITTKETAKLQYTTSTTIRFLSKTSVNYFIVGGGGIGAYWSHESRDMSCAGGGGGYTKTGEIQNNKKDIVIQIGSGGKANGGDGGTTTISCGETSFSANGGKGGEHDSANDGTSVAGSDGGSGSGAADTYSWDPICGNPGSNGGNGGNANGTEGGIGQGTSTTFDGIAYSTAGGSACYNADRRMGDTSGTGRINTNGISGKQYGDGGGASVSTNGTSYSAGSGQQGCVWIYW